MAGRPAAGGIEINTNSAHQLGLSWDLAGLSLAIIIRIDISIGSKRIKYSKLKFFE